VTGIADGPTADARYRGVRVLVLGASGFIGGWVVRALHAQGAVVHAVVREAARAVAPPQWIPQSRIVAADLARPTAVSRVVDAVRPAIVFNLAGYGVDPAEREPAAMMAMNAGLVLELCERLAQEADDGWMGARLVHAGSALEYGPVAGRLDETRMATPTTDYGRTKLLGTEHVVRRSAASGLRAVIARLFTVYGPGEHPDRLLPSLQRLARSGGRLALTAGEQRRDFTYVEDVAEGLLRLGLCLVSPGEVIHLATGRLTSVREFAETAASVLGIDPRALDFGALPVRAEEMCHDEVDIARLRRLTSWSPPTAPSDGIRRSWEAEHAERDAPA
jgi:nucleoside-diphosphate-sugar epimerase